MEGVAVPLLNSLGYGYIGAWALMVLISVVVAVTWALITRRGAPIRWVLLGGVGLFLLGSGLWSAAYHETAKGGPTVQGKIASTDWASGKKRPRVRYTYEVYGAQYTNDEALQGAGRPSSPAALQPRYPAGGAVTVHYAADLPKKSMRFTGAGLDQWLVCALGLLITVAFGYRYFKARGPDIPAIADPR